MARTKLDKFSRASIDANLDRIIAVLEQHVAAKGHIVQFNLGIVKEQIDNSPTFVVVLRPDRVRRALLKSNLVVPQTDIISLRITKEMTVYS